MCLFKNNDCVSHDELKAVEDLITQHGQITDARLDDMQQEYTQSIANIEQGAWYPIDCQLYVDDEVANNDSWSGLAAKFGHLVAFQVNITNRYRLNEAKDNEKLWLEFEEGPSGYASLCNNKVRLEDGNDIMDVTARWVHHPDHGRWMLEFEFLRRKDGSRGFVSKHNNYDVDASGRVIESGSNIGGFVLLPPAF